MDTYLINATDNTPSVHLNTEKGALTIKGNSSTIDPLTFYSRLYDKIENFEASISDAVTVNIALSKISNTSLTYIYILVKKLISAQKADKKVKINWFYTSTNENIKFDAEDLSKFYNFPINIVEVKKAA